MSYVIGNFHTLAAVFQASAKFRLACYDLGVSSRQAHACRENKGEDEIFRLENVCQLSLWRRESLVWCNALRSCDVSYWVMTLFPRSFLERLKAR